MTTTTDKTVDVYTTLDLHLQRVAQDAVRKGLTSVDAMLPKKKRGKAEAALIEEEGSHGHHRWAMIMLTVAALVVPAAACPAPVIGV